MERHSGRLQQERQQAWLEIAGEPCKSSFEFSRFELIDKQEDSTSRMGSSRRGQPAEKKSDQHPARSDGAARSNPKKIEADEGQRMKREGKNPLISLYRDRSPSWSSGTSNVLRSDKSPSQTRGDNHFFRPSLSHSPDPRDLGPKSTISNALQGGSDSEWANGQSGSRRKSARAIKRCVENKALAGIEI